MKNFGGKIWSILLFRLFIHFILACVGLLNIPQIQAFFNSFSWNELPCDGSINMERGWNIRVNIRKCIHYLRRRNCRFGFIFRNRNFVLFYGRWTLKGANIQFSVFVLKYQYINIFPTPLHFKMPHAFYFSFKILNFAEELSRLA